MAKKYVAFLVGLVILSYGCSNPFTPAGHEGFVYENPRVFGKGGFRGAIKGPGNYGASLWRNQIINVDMRPQTYKESFKVLAKDDLNVSFRFEAVIRIKADNVQRVVQDYAGVQWYDRYVQEPFRSFVRNSTQKYTIQTQLVMANSPNHSTVYIPSGANGIPLVKLVE